MHPADRTLSDSREYLQTGRLIACHECDFLHTVRSLPSGGRASCTRCGSLLYRHVPHSIEKALALSLAALMLFILTNAFPFLSIKMSGRVEENVFVSGALALYRMGMGEVGLLVFLTSFLFPGTLIVCMLYMLLPLRFGFKPWKMAACYRTIRALAPWSLMAVFMLGVLIAIVKLLDLVTVIPGPSLYCFSVLMIVMAAASSHLDLSAIWPPGSAIADIRRPGKTAVENGLVGCHTCSFLTVFPFSDHHGRCPRCETLLHSRKKNSVMRTWALILAAAILYIPANIYPVMTVIWFGKGDPNTIFSGIVHLIEGGMWGLAMIIFFASIVVPILKLIVLSFLLICIKNQSSWRLRDRTVLFRVTEAVGAWSMVDVYVVAVLAALVNLDALATIRPGIGVAFFGAVVVITMFAAHSFDPRLIWDNSGNAPIENGLVSNASP